MKRAISILVAVLVAVALALFGPAAASTASATNGVVHPNN